MSHARIFADFANAAADGCLRLDASGTLQDLRRTGVLLRPGLVLWLCDGERIALAQVADCEGHGARHARLLAAPVAVDGG